MDRMKKVDMMEENIIEQLGEERALQAIIKALSYDTKEDIYEYICMVYEIETEEEED